MELRSIAFGSLKRRRGKAFLITFGLAVAVAAFVLVVSLILSMRATVDDTLSKYGSNLLVTPASSELNLSYGGMTIASAGTGEVRHLSGDDLSKVTAVPSNYQIVAALPVMLQPLTVDGRPFLGMGTDLLGSLAVKPWWKLEGTLPDAAGEVMAGLNVRNELGIEPGDRVRIEGRELSVSAVLLETGGEEDNLVIMDRRVLEDLVGKRGEINLIEVTARSTDAVDELTAEIGKALPQAAVTSIRKSIELTNQTNSALASFGLAVSLLIVLISGLVVMITMLGAVKERQKEIGIFRAIGYKQKHVALLIFLETSMLSGSAAVAGVVVGIVGALTLPRLFGQLELSFVFSPLLIVGGVMVAFLVGWSAALYPAWRAANLDPATALKYI